MRSTPPIEITMLPWITTPELRTWSRMSSSESSSLPSPPSTMVLGLAILVHKRIWRPGACAFDAPAAFPRGGKSFEHLLQLFLLRATDEKRGLPFEVRAAAADLARLFYGSRGYLL